MITDKSLRRFLQALSDKGYYTTVDLIGATETIPYEFTVATNQACKDGLIEYVHDITGRMVWRITEKGRRLLADIQAAEQATDVKPEEITPTEPTRDVEDAPKKAAGYEYFVVIGADMGEVLYAGNDVSNAIKDAEFEARARKENAVVYRAEVVGEAVLSAKFIPA